MRNNRTTARRRVASFESETGPCYVHLKSCLHNGLSSKERLFKYLIPLKRRVTIQSDYLRFN